jgi:hypothetical protein
MADPLGRWGREVHYTTKTLLLLKPLSANKKATANSGFEGRLKLN